MNMLFVSNLYPPVVFGGYEILASQVAETLRRRGHEIFVQTSDFRSDECASDPWVSRDLQLTTDFPRPGEDTSLPDFSLTTMDRVGRRNLASTCRLLDHLPEVFSNGHGADCVFAWNLNRLTLGPLFAAQEHGLPHFWTLNDLHPRQFWVAPDTSTPRRSLRIVWERFIRPYATLRNLPDVRTTVISHALHRQLLQLNVPVPDATVLYQGIPLDQFPHRPQTRQADEPLRMLYVGQLSAAKGVHTILGALRTLPEEQRRGFELTVIGDGVAAYEANLRRLTDGIGCKVEFSGRVPHEHIARAHRDHHVLIFPSEWEEPFGLAHLEAMASGCAVISTATGGTAELVRHRQNALVFRSGDPDDLATQMITLDSREALRRELVRNARREVESEYSMDAYVDRLEQFLAIRGGAASRPVAA